MTPRRSRGAHGALGYAITAIGVLLLLMLAGAVWALLFSPVVEVPAGRQVEVEIPRGSDTRTIGEILASHGVVANVNMFRLRSRIEGADGKYKAGVYRFVTGLDYGPVISALEEGPAEVVFTVPIPEGFTIDQIAQRFEARAGVPATDLKRLATTQAASFRPRHPFLAADPTPTLEGYLFPKTYRVKKGTSASGVIDMMLDQFADETQGLDLRYAERRGLGLHGVVTIASMIERETRLAKERPVVSSVIHNRLAKGMRLEIDATVQYVLGNKPRLLYRDLRVQSPYNTYLHKGLPPGPIASPGLDSLKAAADPARTAYLYYVLTGKDGSHTFATNEADFLAAKKRAKGGLR